VRRSCCTLSHARPQSIFTCPGIPIGYSLPLKLHPVTGCGKGSLLSFRNIRLRTSPASFKGSGLCRLLIKYRCRTNFRDDVSLIIRRAERSRHSPDYTWLYLTHLDYKMTLRNKHFLIEFPHSVEWFGQILIANFEIDRMPICVI